MKAMSANRGVTIDLAGGDRLVVAFGGCGAGAWPAKACNGGLAGASESVAESPVILWDEVGAMPLASQLATRS